MGAIAGIVVSIVLSVISAAISARMALKNIKNAKPETGSVPQAKDGTGIRKIYGTVWVDDSQVLAWKDLPPEPIKSKAGKK
jgi:hypothetical protein